MQLPTKCGQPYSNSFCAISKNDIYLCFLQHIFLKFEGYDKEFEIELATKYHQFYSNIYSVIIKITN